MSHVCHHCGSPQNRKVAETGLFVGMGYKLADAFPFRKPVERTVRLCTGCNEMYRRGTLRSDPPLYHPLSAPPIKA